MVKIEFKGKWKFLQQLWGEAQLLLYSCELRWYWINLSTFITVILGIKGPWTWSEGPCKDRYSLTNHWRETPKTPSIMTNKYLMKERNYTRTVLVYTEVWFPHKRGQSSGPWNRTPQYKTWPKKQLLDLFFLNTGNRHECL